eukprot:PITA_33896
MSTIVQTKPCTFEEAVKHQVWKDAMNEEYEYILKNDVWDVVPRLKDKSLVTSKWLYKIKHGADGSVERYKIRFVARGLSQKEGVDNDKIFSQVARYSTIRSIILLLLPLKNGAYIKWTLKLLSCMTCLRRKSSWNNLRGSKYKIEGHTKQKLVALSTAEAEYIAANMACCDVLGLWKLFSELFEHVLVTTVIFCYNYSGIHLLENPVFQDCSKHIDIRYHFIWDMVQ